MKIHSLLNQAILLLGIVVFTTSVFVSWLKSDISYWPLLLHDAGFIWAEIPAIIFYRTAIANLLELIGNSFLLLTSFYVGQKYELTKVSTIFLFVLLSVCVLLGLLLGYGMKQIEMPEYPIFDVGILYVVPSELIPKIVWCMFGVFLGSWRTRAQK